MCHEPLADPTAIHELNVSTDLTALQIARVVGRSESYVLGFLGGHYRDNSAYDAMGESQVQAERDDFLAGWSAGEAAWYATNGAEVEGW